MAWLISDTEANYAAITNLEFSFGNNTALEGDVPDLNVAVLDATATAETLSLGGVPNPVAVETVTTSETRKVDCFSIAVRETVTTLERRVNVTNLGYKFVYVTESVSTAEGVARNVLIGTAEFTSVRLDSNVGKTETTATSETIGIGLTTRFVAIAETTATAEFVSAPFPSGISALDTTATADAGSPFGGDLFLIAVDATTTAESASAPIVGPVSVAETTTTAEAVQAQVSTLSVVATEIVLASDFPFASPILDNFNRANYGPPLGGPWVPGIDMDGTAGLRVVSNQATGAISGFQSEGYNQQFPGPLEFYVTLAAIGGANEQIYLWAAVPSGSLVSNTEMAGYAVYVLPSTLLCQIYLKVIGLGLVVLQMGTLVSLNAGDKLGVKVAGGVVSAWHKPGSAAWYQVAFASDSTFTSGGAAIEIVGTTWALDDFGGGAATFSPILGGVPNPVAADATATSESRNILESSQGDLSFSVADFTATSDLDAERDDLNVVASDTSSLSILPPQVIALDTITTTEHAVVFTDTLTVFTVTDTTATSEAIALSPLTLFLAVADTAATAEGIVAQCPGPVAALDTATIFESASVAETSASVLAITVAETATSSEFVSAPFPSPIAALDTTATSEAVSVPPLLIQDAEVESTTVTSSVNLQCPSPIAITETTATSEMVGVAFGIAESDTTTVSETVRAIPISPFSMYIIESTATAEFFVVGIPPVITFSYEVAVADTVTTAETPIVARQNATTFTDSETESVTTSESVTVGLVPFVVNRADQTATSESVVLGRDLFVVTTDVVVSAETTTPSIVIPGVAVTDTVTTADSDAVTSADVLAVTDTVVTTETAIVQSGGVNPAVLDATSTVETPIVRVDGNVVALDATSTADLDATTLAYNVAVPETTTTAESVSARFDVNIAVADVTATREFAAQFTLSAFETATPESILTSETTSAHFDFAAVATDSVTTSEPVARAVFSHDISINETATTAEGPAALLVDLVGVVDSTATSESLALTQALTVAISETTSTFESESTAETATLLPPALDTTSTSEAVALTFTGFLAVGEFPVSSEQVILSETGNLVIVREVAGSAEFVAANPTINVSVTQAATTTETASAGGPLAITIVETTTTAESATPAVSFDSAFTADSTSTSEMAIVQVPGVVSFVVAGDSTTTAEVVGIFVSSPGIAPVETVSVSETVAGSPTIQTVDADSTATTESVAAVLNVGLQTISSDSTATGEVVYVQIVSRWVQGVGQVRPRQREAIVTDENFVSV